MASTVLRGRGGCEAASLLDLFVVVETEIKIGVTIIVVPRVCNGNVITRAKSNAPEWCRIQISVKTATLALA